MGIDPAGWQSTPAWDYGRVFNGRVEQGIRTSVVLPYELAVQMEKLVRENDGIESKSSFIRTAVTHLVHYWGHDDVKLRGWEAGVIAAQMERDRHAARDAVERWKRLFNEAIDDLDWLATVIAGAERVLDDLSESPKYQRDLADMIATYSKRLGM